MGDTASLGNPFWPGNFPDPFVLKVRGRYYAYATEGDERPAGDARVFPILTSPDLVRWEQAGSAMPALGARYFRYWAPEVTEHNGRFLLYYAVHTGEFEAAIRVAVADRPEGPFEDSGRDLTAGMFPWAIDPHVFRDADGRWYLYMTVEYWDDPEGLVGSGNAVARMADPFTLEPGPARVTPPRHAWELFEARRREKGGIDWYCVEGPAVFRHRGRYYEMFSGGCYYRDNYAVSYATSPVPMGRDGMRDASWRDWPGTDGDGDGVIVRGDGERLISPGHNSLVYGPNNADLYMVYHAQSRDRAGRCPCLDRLYCHGDTLWTPAPTHDPQPAPAQPRLKALHGAAGDTARWHSMAGQWTLCDDEATTEDAVTDALLLHDEPLGPAWLLEVNLRHLDGDGRYGVALRGADAAETRIMLDPARKRIAVATKDGDEVHAPLSGDFAPGAWRQLLLAYAGEVLDVRLDGLSLARLRAPGSPERFALYGDHCRASFTAISLTDHFRDEFLDDRFTPAMLGWRDAAMHAGSTAPGSHWRVHDGALEQCEPRRDTEAICKGAALRDGEVGATLRLLAPGDAQVALGLVAIDGDWRPLRLWLERHEGRWVLAAETDQGQGAEGGARRELPTAFDPCAWHTLRAERRGSGLAFTLDGGDALRVATPDIALIFGLTTRHAAAAFTGVWQTGYPSAGAHS